MNFDYLLAAWWLIATALFVLSIAIMEGLNNERINSNENV